MPAIERLHASDYELISPPGRVMTRERYLSLIAAKAFYAKWEHGAMRVRLAAGMAELQVGSWKAVWSQATQLPPDALPSTDEGRGAIVNGK